MDRANLTGNMMESQREAAAAAHFEKRSMYDAVRGDEEEMKEAAALHVDKRACTRMSSWRVLKRMDKFSGAAGAVSGRRRTGRKGQRTAARGGAAGACARRGQAAPTYGDGVVEHDEDEDGYPAACQARPFGTKTAKVRRAPELSLAGKADATRATLDRMAGVAERRAESACCAGPDVRCTPEAAQGLQLEMRRRLEALGKTREADSEALDTWATDAATADPLTPPASLRGRTAGFSGLDGPWLKGCFVSP